MIPTYFKNKTHIYDRYRPNYPNFVYKFLFENCIKKNSILAEFGCGTGKLTEILLKNDNTLYAFEPDVEMFNFVKNRFLKSEELTVYNSSAEESHLPDNSIDIIIAGQAFHLFNIEKTKKEFLRILKPDGKIILLWYFLDMEYSISKDIRHLFYKYRDILKQSHRNRIDKDSLGEIFYPLRVDFNALGNFKQDFKEQDFIQSMLSSSYAPDFNNKSHGRYIDEAKKIFSKYSVNNSIEYFFKVDSYCISNTY